MARPRPSERHWARSRTAEGFAFRTLWCRGRHCVGVRFIFEQTKTVLSPLRAFLKTYTPYTYFLVLPRSAHSPAPAGARPGGES